jgi:hypothetical protein
MKNSFGSTTLVASWYISVVDPELEVKDPDPKLEPYKKNQENLQFDDYDIQSTLT